MSTKLSVLVAAVLLVSCGTPFANPCGELGVRVRTDSRDLCVYPPSLSAGLECPAALPARTVLTDIVICSEETLASAERREVCGLVGSRCEETSTGTPETAEVGESCTFVDALADIEPSAECSGELGLTTACLRGASDSHCTCRCESPYSFDVPLCACPNGMVCRTLTELPSSEWKSGYCVRP